MKKGGAKGGMISGIAASIRSYSAGVPTNRLYSAGEFQLGFGLLYTRLAAVVRHTDGPHR